MNKSRELFLLFPNQEVIPQGYCRIYAFTSMNDEPPYKMCTFCGIGNKYGGVYEEDGESLFYYLIRKQDAQKFVQMNNQQEKGRLEDIYQYTLERNYGDNNLSNQDIESIAKSNNRKPKIRYMNVAPYTITKGLDLDGNIVTIKQSNIPCQVVGKVII